MADLQIDPLASKLSGKGLFIVGIGASAGGIEALQTFFQNTPADSGMAFVVILHLSPDFESNLHEILASATSMPVTQVKERVQVKANHVYVIAPSLHLTMADDHIEVSQNLTLEERRAPVDIFFRTLAESHTNRAIAVILSGTGANGSMGIKRIKERGGAAFVQRPSDAMFDDMPRNSIATNLIDEVLVVEDIPARILSYRQNLGKIEIDDTPEKRAEEEQQALREIFLQVRLRTGNDFTNYKRPTLLRRIERRINVRNLPDLVSYAAYIRDNPDEITALLKDLLISVTNFFRDKEAFDYIEKELLPKIIKDKKPGDAIRVWVAGCATGEEAYSFAMLCAEQVLGVIDAPTIQIFATDIDNDAISIARDGFYTLNDAADISPERLRLFFTKEGKDYRVRREVREMILFASHNVLKDPPFSRIDIISCRNMLIYLNSIGQERVMETFHFALNPGSYLFLGNSESADNSHDLYAVINRELRIFQSRAINARLYPLPESIPALRAATPPPVAHLIEDKPVNERVSYGDLHQRLLETYAPPSLIVNEDYDILHVSENAGKFLQVSGGEPTRNLLNLIRQDIRLEVRTALYQATEKQINVDTGTLHLQIGGREEAVNVQVRPVPRASGDTARGFILILFSPDVAVKPAEERVLSNTDSITQQLEKELMNSKVQLRSTSEQYEIQTEELKASNEELQALNEELRSAAEELETSKEELQTINEELRTVNQELKIKIEETSLANNNLQNFINSSDIGTIFLDRSLSVRLFTPSARQIYNLIISDAGRPLTDITSKLEYTSVLQDAETVLETLQPVEREVTTITRQTYLMRVTPYRTTEDHINGVIISFVNITQRKKSDEALGISEERFRAFVTTSSDVLYLMNADWSTMQNLKGMSFLDDTIDPSTTWVQKYIPEWERQRVQNALDIAINGKSIFHLEHQVYQTDGSVGWVRSTATPILDAQNEIIEWFGSAKNITVEKERENNLRKEEEVYRTELESQVASRTGELKQSRDQFISLLENSPDAVTRWDKDLKLIYANSTFETNIGAPDNELSGKDYMEMGQPYESAHPYMTALRSAVDTGETVEHFHSFQTPSGEAQYYTRIVPETDESGNVVSLLATARDISTLRKTQEELLNLKDEIAKKVTNKYETLFNSIDDGFCIIQMIYDEKGAPVDWIYIEANPTFEKLTGKNIIGKKASEVDGNCEESWLSFYNGVTVSGEAAKTENKLGSLNRWYRINASRIDGGSSHQVAVIFDDITERKNREEQLLLDKKRESFLLSFTDALRTISNPDSVQLEACRLLGGELEADRVNYAEVDGENYIIENEYAAENLSGTKGKYPISAFRKSEIKSLRSGKTVVVTDIVNEPELSGEERQVYTSINVGSFVSVPLVKEGNLIAVFGVIKTHSYAWSHHEISLIEEVAERTWSAVERAKAEDALAYSETKLRIVMKASGIGTWVWNIEEDHNEADSFILDMFGNPLGRLLGIEQIAAQVYPPDLSAFLEAVTKASDPEGTGFLNIEFRIVAQDDSFRWINSVGQTFFEGEPKRATMMVGSSINITGRKEAAEELRLSEERYRAFFKQSTAGVAEFDENGNVLLANETFCQTLGVFSAEEMIGVNTRQITHPDSLHQCLENFALAFEKSQSSSMEKKMLSNDGTIVWITESITPLCDEYGDVKSVLAVGIDITNRKKTEMFTRESEERYRVALEAGELATWDWNLKTDKVVWNSQHFRLFGIDHNEDTINAQYFLEFVYPEDIALVKQQLLEVVGNRGIYNAEFRIRRKDNGKLRWMTGYGRITERENGKPIRVSGVMFDSTERRESEEALEATKNSLSTALEAAKMGVWTMNMTHGYMDRSSKHDELLGYDGWQEEWNYSKGRENVIEEDKTAYDTAFENLFESGVFDLEARVKNVDGSICWVRYFGRTFRDDDGKGETAAGVIFDITNQKTIEKQKDEFIGVASHELKTPVTSIKAYAEILQEMFTDKQDFESAELMGKLDGQIDRLTNLIKDLLDVTKISEGQLHLTTVSFDMSAQIRNVVEDMQRTTRQHRIVVNITPLPDVVGDKERLAQVLVNMMSNAIKYSPGAKEVKVDAAYENGQVRISVQDFGIGMSPGTLEKLFARFFRSDNPTIRSFPGLGLGLFISMEIMKRHGGTISVQSEKGKGSVFTMILPVE